MAAGEARWLPNYDEFFFSLGNLLNTCEQQLNSTPSDRSEFLFRRLDEYERTLSTLISRFCETYGHELSQQTCLADVTLILRRTSFLRSHVERHCFLLEDEVDVSRRADRRSAPTERYVAGMLLFASVKKVSQRKEELIVIWEPTCCPGRHFDFLNVLYEGVSVRSPLIS